MVLGKATYPGFAPVKLNALCAGIFNVVVDPAHIATPGTVLIIGGAFKVTVVVYTVPELQPEPLLLTVTEYVLVTVGVAVGLAAVVDDKLGPLHAYINVPVPPVPFAVSVTVLPLHIGPLFVGAAVGTANTFTVLVFTDVKPLPSVAVTVYTVVTEGDADTAAPVVALSPVAGDHL